MKILIVSDGIWDIYAESFFNGFKVLNYDIYKFYWKKYFEYNSMSSRIQDKLIFGPIVFKINKDLIRECKTIKPDLVFIYRGTHIHKSTIEQLKLVSNCKVYGYNNDDPFSLKHSKYSWRYFVRSIPSYDHIFAYRTKNIEDFNKIKYHNVSILRSYYRREHNYNILNLDITKYKCDVIFIGHFEDDGRDDVIKLLIDNNIDVTLYGSGWNKSKHYNYLIKYLKRDIENLYNEQYNLALNSAKIALVFLSKLNNDTYTRRCFEIPATKTMMLSEYTDDLNSMFQKGVDAEYFKDKGEIMKKIKYYLEDNTKIENIGGNGFDRLMRDGHEVVDRCKQVIEVYNSYKCSNKY